MQESRLAVEQQVAQAAETVTSRLDVSREMEALQNTDGGPEGPVVVEKEQLETAASASGSGTVGQAAAAAAGRSPVSAIDLRSTLCTR